ncbi:MAG: glycosyltransferase family protein [Candidatus Altiarchaeota archaeon]|nr:glycosyltransferase family protein [Candidatus Altiarchaeota archaeon]
MKAMIFMCGEGLGHTSRCLSIGKALVDEGFKVVFCAYGYSKKHIEGAGFSVLEIPSEITLIGEAGSLDMRESIEETLKRADPLMYPKVINLIRKEQPDIVLSDGYFTAAVAAKIQKKPFIFILNQTDVSNFFRNRGVDVSIVGNLVVTFADIVHRYVDKIIIPDFPPPYTICARNAELNKNIVDKVVYSGPLVRKKYSEVKEADVDKPHILCSIGGFGYRKKLLSNIIEAARATPHTCYTLLGGPNVTAESFKKVPGNVSFLSYLNNVFPYIKASGVVITAGGHSSLMECLCFGKPVLSFPDMFHSEQQNNAQRLEELKLGKKMSYFTPAFMINDCIEEVKNYSRNMVKMREYAEKLNGTVRVLDEIKGLI